MAIVEFASRPAIRSIASMVGSIDVQEFVGGQQLLAEIDQGSLLGIFLRAILGRDLLL